MLLVYACMIYPQHILCDLSWFQTSCIYYVDMIYRFVRMHQRSISCPWKHLQSWLRTAVWLRKKPWARKLAGNKYGILTITAGSKWISSCFFWFQQKIPRQDIGKSRLWRLPETQERSVTDPSPRQSQWSTCFLKIPLSRCWKCLSHGGVPKPF